MVHLIDDHTASQDQRFIKDAENLLVVGRRSRGMGPRGPTKGVNHDLVETILFIEKGIAYFHASSQHITTSRSDPHTPPPKGLRRLPR